MNHEHSAHGLNLRMPTSRRLYCPSDCRRCLGADLRLRPVPLTDDARRRNLGDAYNGVSRQNEPRTSCHWSVLADNGASISTSISTGSGSGRCKRGIVEHRSAWTRPLAAANGRQTLATSLAIDSFLVVFSGTLAREILRILNRRFTEMYTRVVVVVVVCQRGQHLD